MADLVFHDPLEAGKVMGLAPYGRPTLPVDDFFTIDEDGRFHFVDRLRARFRDLEPWPHNEQAFADLAASAQAALERAVVFLAERARRLTGASRLCYAGGVALNGVANELVHTRLGFDDVYVMPAAEDSGTAIGAAYHGLHALTGRLARRRLDGDRRGRSYPLAEIETALVVTPHVEPVACADVLDAVVDRLCAGEIVGWFQGGSELGPRALGQRSILCDARRPDAKALLNERVKRREGFRPFAPAILLDQVRDWFDVPAGFRDSPSMLRVCRFVDGRAEAVPGAAHIDGTGRLQTVTEENGRFYHLLARFHLRTGVPLLVNTSFNIAGEPIVETPEDALWCLLATQIDAVAIEDRLVRRAEAHRSILQLRPRLRAHRLRVDLPITDGSLRLKIPADAGVSIVTSTPYGELSHRIRASDTLLLGLCDGTRDGWQILAALRGRQGYVPEELVARRLCFYRRAHVIALGAD